MKGYGPPRGNARRRLPDKACEGCGGAFRPTARGTRYCTRDCYLTNGCTRRYLRSDGYVRVWVPEGTPGRGSKGRMLEHRWVMQQHLGRELTDEEYVHHRNGDRADNRLENLQLVHKFHGKGAVLRCRCCGSDDIEAVEI